MSKVALPGSHAVRGNGKDDQSAALLSGVHLCQMVTPEYARPERVVLVR